MKQGLPFIRLLAPLIFGICLGEVFPGHPDNSLLIGLMVLFWLLAMGCTKISVYRFQPLFGGCVFFLLTWTGIYLAHRSQPEPSTPDQWQRMAGIVLATPTVYTSGVRVMIDSRISRLESSEERKTDFLFREKMIVYAFRDSLTENLKTGDLVVFRAKPERIRLRGDPYEFDYPSYYRGMGICRQVYIAKGNLKKIRRISSGKNLNLLREKAGQYWETLFAKAGLQEESMAVACALTLGVTSGLDAEIKQSYAASGASHLLSVSGLHTGIVAAVLMTLLGFMARIPGWSGAREGLVISGIWAYAWLTGFSPSVSRSALMFSLLIAGRWAGPDRNSIHTVAVSAFFLLVIRPRLLFDTGFQLSYAAVTAIILLYNPIRELIPGKNFLFIKIRDLCIVSLTAQLGTLPFCLGYFHQFPVYFLLTNIVVVPLTGIIVWGAVMLWISSPVSFLFIPASWIFRHLMSLLNECVRGIESWPGALVENIGFSAPDGFFYLILFSIFCFCLIRKNRRMILYALFTGVVWSGYHLAEKCRNQDRELILVYARKEKAIVQWIRGNRQSVFYAAKDSLIVRKTIQRAQWAMNIRESQWISWEDSLKLKKFGTYSRELLQAHLSSLRKGVFYSPGSQTGGSDGIRSDRSILRSRDAAPR